jgi:hypothetical protein
VNNQAGSVDRSGEVDVADLAGSAETAPLVDVVQVEAQRCERPQPGFGVGTRLAEDLVLTAGHVVDGNLRRLEVGGADATVVALDRALDLAIVDTAAHPSLPLTHTESGVSVAADAAQTPDTPVGGGGGTRDGGLVGWDGSAWSGVPVGGGGVAWSGVSVGGGGATRSGVPVGGGGVAWSGAPVGGGGATRSGPVSGGDAAEWSAWPIDADAAATATPGTAQILLLDAPIDTEIGRVLTLRVDDLTDGVVYERPALELDVVVDQGDSGAPVLDQAGQVIGVVVLRREGRGVSYATRIPPITELLATVLLSPTPAAPGRCGAS